MLVKKCPEREHPYSKQTSSYSPIDKSNTSVFGLAKSSSTLLNLFSARLARIILFLPISLLPISSYELNPTEKNTTQSNNQGTFWQRPTPTLCPRASPLFTSEHSPLARKRQRKVRAPRKKNYYQEGGATCWLFTSPPTRKSSWKPCTQPNKTI